ncbi:phytanoyl-CoA dioxygenase family protein [Amycolatopsis circi]|uniref:phytanoyl-CoA dioxygenase family protein n=1 Tax=Amycolatopsis circi TaxID=871959 RepID=UPI000E24032E|nr:phytanoyl-CoA dioxygenase family protein [Amycolatopsis circi]
MTSPAPLLADPAHQRDYDRDGYLVSGSTLPEAALAGLDSFYAAHAERYASPRYASTLAFGGDHDHRSAADAVFRHATRDAAAGLLVDCLQYYGGLGVKTPSGDTTTLELHQDLTMVPYDRPRCGITLWSPLCDVAEDNGCLYVVPGSHRINRQPRAAGMPFAYQGSADRIRRGHIVPLPVRRGQIVLMDQALIHSSGPNNSPRVRVAAMGMLRPAEVGLVYYHLVRGADGPVLRRYAVPDDFYLRQRLGAPPRAGILVHEVPPRVTPHVWS